MIFFPSDIVMGSDSDSDFSDLTIKKVSSVSMKKFDFVPKDIDFDLKIKGITKVRFQYILKKDKILPYTAYLEEGNLFCNILI